MTVGQPTVGQSYATMLSERLVAIETELANLRVAIATLQANRERYAMLTKPTGRQAGILALQAQLPNLPPNNEVEAALYRAMSGIIRGDGQFSTEALVIRGDKQYSTTGKLNQLSALARKQGDWIRAAETAIETAQRYIETRQSAIVAGLKPEASDVVGELRRQELRAYLRTLSPTEAVVIAGGDPIVGEAVLTAHRVVSGLSAEQFEGVRTRYLTIQPDAAALTKLTDMIVLVNSALSMAKSEIADALGSDLPAVAA